MINGSVQLLMVVAPSGILRCCLIAAMGPRTNDAARHAARRNTATFANFGNFDPLAVRNCDVRSADWSTAAAFLVEPECIQRRSLNKSSAVAEMGDRATAVGRIWGVAVPLP